MYVMSSVVFVACRRTIKDVPSYIMRQIMASGDSFFPHSSRKKTFCLGVVVATNARTHCVFYRVI